MPPFLCLVRIELFERHLAVGANDLGSGDTGVPRRFLGDCIPLDNRALERDACKATARRERRIADARDTTGDSDACKATAILERTIADACNALGNNYIAVISVVLI